MRKRDPAGLLGMFQLQVTAALANLNPAVGQKPRKNATTIHVYKYTS